MFTLAAAAVALDNGFRLPQLGWNSWNHFGCGVTEQDIKDTADAFVATGMKAAGYACVNVDDCWMAMNRSADGKLTHDPVRFPSGMKALSKYVHERGLKFGLYSARCGHTCQGRPGSEDHEWTDAQTFASWDVDYLKYDNCGSCKYGYSNTPAKVMQVTRMGDALRRWGAEGSGRPIFYSTEMGGEQLFNADICNSAREGSDITASWESVLYELDVGSEYADLAKPGYHNDFDMLEVGNGRLTQQEEEAHMAIWCLMSSPLLAGNNLTAATPEVVKILTAPGPISVNQDELALQGWLCGQGTDGAGGVWQACAKPLADGATAALLLNRNASAEVNASVDFRACNVSRHAASVVTDLWSAATLGSYTSSWSAVVPPHSHRLVKIAPPAAPLVLA